MTENGNSDDFLLRPDHSFAAVLDLNCNQCLEKETDRQTQIETLNQRKETHPEEERFLKALEEKCQACGELGNSITSTHSCMYRGGIRKRS